MLHGHGDDGYCYDKPIIANFSSNVYYNGLTEGLKKHLIAAVEQIRVYPETDARSLQHCLAKWHGLSADQLLITNGATEAFYLIAHHFRNKTATIVIPSFAEYEDACSANKLQLQFLEWEKLNSGTQFLTDVVFFGNPNNPTGAALNKSISLSLLKNNPRVIFIIDEAYTDFTEEKISMVTELGSFSNLIVVKSLTKTHAIPGLRLGYMLGTSSLIEQITSCKMPWSVNALAIEAGKYIVRQDNPSPLPLRQLLTDTKQLIHQLEKIKGLTIQPTSTNFFLCKTIAGTSAELKSFLLEEFGLLIRDASNFRGLTKNHFRISTQVVFKNELLIKGIRKWIDHF